MTFMPTGDPHRPLDSDAVYFIRLWYLGRYNGAEALRRLSIRQIGQILQRSEARVREALGPYVREADRV
ncbi:MAG: hypothetical protein IJY28_00395 [Clostridia bacterium]|nr:hypothetical protein [Clostridia bacterium]